MSDFGEAKETEELEKEINVLKSEIQGFVRTLSSHAAQIETLETRTRERSTIADAYMFSKIITGTTSASAGTETTHAHPLGRDPKFVFITSKSNGVVYLTDKDKDNIKVKGSASSLDFTAYLLA